MLGFVLVPLGQKVDGQFPSDINYAIGGAGTFLCPEDPQYNQHGEAGFYPDTQLGGPAIPTDAELSTIYGYTPVNAGWVNAQEGYMPGPWRVPGGWNPAGAYGPQAGLGGLQDVSVQLPASSTSADAQAVVDALNAQNARVFKVTVISAIVVGFAAVLNSYRLIKQLRREERLLRKMEA